MIWRRGTCQDGFSSFRCGRCSVCQLEDERDALLLRVVEQEAKLRDLAAAPVVTVAGGTEGGGRGLMADECAHQFVFLRQDKVNEGFDRNPRWAHYDVFFCERCLAYERIKVYETVPARDRFGEDVVWRLR